MHPQRLPVRQVASGLALVVVVGVLGVSVILAVCFVTLARLERRASQQRIHATQALLLARSGIEDALARIAQGQDPSLMSPGGPGRGLPGFFAEGRDYAVRVVDESGKLCVNGGIPGADTTRGWNGQLRRILGNLGRRLGLPNLGEDLMTRRPAEGYRSMAEVQAAAGTMVDLSPHLCLAAWTDLKVIRPNATPLSYEAVNDLKKARGSLGLEEGGRPPVNLNAAPKALLAALAEGLRGASCRRISGPAPETAVTSAAADAFADALLISRNAVPFESWPAFEIFVDSLVPTVLPGDVVDADVIKANFNPNTMLSKQMPDEIAWRFVDKSDLKVWSTEGSLGPTGHFRISAAGRVTDPAGRLLASAERSVSMRAFELLRHTTQRDFVGDRRPDAGGTSYLSLASAAPVPPSPPERTTGASATWNTWGLGRGLAVITYPCPMTALPSNAADFDGSVGLASTELVPEGPSYPGSSLRFLQHFDDGWTADLAVAGGSLRNVDGRPTTEPTFQDDPGVSVWPSAPVEPNTLHPDGAYLQLGRSPSYFADNLPVDADPTSDHGAICFWTKRDLCKNPKTFTEFSFCKYKDNLLMTSPPRIIHGTQILAVGAQHAAATLGLHIESWSWDSDHEHELGVSQVVQRPQYAPDMRWHFLAACYDDDDLEEEDSVWVSAMGLYTGRIFAYGHNPFDPQTGEKLIEGRNRVFTLGTTGTLGNRPSILADSVMDEFAILDFGDRATEVKPRFEEWATLRFREGRYYKGDDGTFLSTEIRPAASAPCRILRAFWTGRLPSHPRPECLAPGEHAIPPVIAPRLLDARLSRARLEVSLLDASGTLTGPVLQTLERSGGTVLDWTLPSFRYRVRFICQVPDPRNDPVLETPFLDDITFAWQPLSGPRILDWSG